MICVTYTCRHCGDEMPVEVIIGEEDDLPEYCPACCAPIPDSAHEEVYESAVGRAEAASEDDR